MPLRGPAGGGDSPAAPEVRTGVDAAHSSEAEPVARAAAPAESAESELERPQDPSAVQASDAPVRISRRTPIAVPGFGSPTPQVETHAAIDEYFDRLDAAFATLNQAPAASTEETAPPSHQVPDAGEPEPAAAAAARDQRTQPTAGPPPAASGKTAPPAAGIAQAFSALFAAERGEAVPELPAFIGPAAFPQSSMDDLVERVTRQVLERLSDRVVRDTVTDVVSRVAERLVRDEIERVKATLK
jgi:hypothetical protein